MLMSATTHRFSLLLLSAAALAMLAGRAQAQGEALDHATPTTGSNASLEEEKPAAGPKFSVTPFATHTFEADFSDGPGNVSVSRAGAEISMRQPIGDRSRLTVSLGAEFSLYDFGDTSPFAISTLEPWNDTSQVSLTVAFSRQVTPEWSVFFGGGVDASFENDADISNAFTGGLLGGATYQVSPTFSIGGGFAVRSRLEDSGLFLPLLSLDWKINDQWRLSNFNELNSFGLALSYQPCDTFEVSLRGAYQSRAYRLDEDGPFPDGVGRDSRIPLWVQARYNITPRAAVNASLGYVVWQEFTVDDTNGIELANEEADATPFVGIGFSLLF